MSTPTIQLPDLTRAAHAVRDMRGGVVISKTTAAERARMQQLAASNRELQARLRELEAAETARQDAAKIMAHRLAFMESRTLHVRDNTASYRQPQVVATTDAVHLALPLNPRTAIPLALPLLSQLHNWLHLKW